LPTDGIVNNNPTRYTMPETTITTAQSNQLELLQTLNYNNAAVKEAVEFIQNEPFKHRLFIQQYQRLLNNGYPESDVVSRAITAVQESTEALAVINTTTATE